MKPISFIFAVLFCTIGKVYSNDADQVILKTSQTLNRLKSISYFSYREINNYQDNYFSKDSGACYFEYLAPANTLSRFQLRADHTFQVYNGTEYFTLDDQNRSIETERRTPKQLGSVSLLYNSITNIRIVLPLLLADAQIPRSLKDTLIEGKNFYLIQFALHKKSMEFPDGFSNYNIELTKYYKLVIDPETYLPYMVFDQNSISKEKYYTKTIFSKIQTDVPVPEEKTWYFSSYPGYTPRKKGKQKPMIAKGSSILPWSLPNYGNSNPDTVTSKKLYGKIVLMEFWIKNCAYCMAAFPDLKALQEKYGRSIEILSINAYEKKEEIDFFFKREQPGYKMLYNGEILANTLGISAYPATLLINENGQVIYASEGFNATQTEEAIKQAIARQK